LTDPDRARCALPRRLRSRICAFSYYELHPGPGSGELLDEQRLVVDRHVIPYLGRHTIPYWPVTLVLSDPGWGCQGWGLGYQTPEEAYNEYLNRQTAA
jgi:hypothetical protein